MLLKGIVVVSFAAYMLFCLLKNSFASPLNSNEIRCQPVQVNQEEAESECRNATYNVNECDRTICGSDKLCIEYHQIANNLQYHPYLDVRNVTNLENKGSGPHLNYLSMNAYIGRECSNINLNSNLVNDTSFSPWEYVINRDENRIPRDILETRCCNRLCLNFNRIRTNGRLRSVPVMVTRYFHMKDNGTEVFDARFSYGCICDYQ